VEIEMSGLFAGVDRSVVWTVVGLTFFALVGVLFNVSLFKLSPIFWAAILFSVFLSVYVGLLHSPLFVKSYKISGVAFLILYVVALHNGLFDLGNGGHYGPSPSEVMKVISTVYALLTLLVGTLLSSEDDDFAKWRKTRAAAKTENANGCH
jgi:hypothetical protein